MKKPVLFVIAIVFVLSIVIVNFFGIAVRNDQFKNYVQKVEIKSDDIEMLGNAKWLFVSLAEDEETISFFIETVCTPANADDQNVSYTVIDINTDKPCVKDEHDPYNNTVVVNKNGEVVVYKKAIGNSYKIIVKTVDGSNVTDEINLFVEKKK